MWKSAESLLDKGLVESLPRCAALACANAYRPIT
jgi:hypothetical protein